MNIDKVKNSRTKIIGKRINYFKEVDSTHLEAKRIVEKEVNGKLLIAEYQTQGIGTKGRQWYAGKR